MPKCVSECTMPLAPAFTDGLKQRCCSRYMPCWQDPHRCCKHAQAWQYHASGHLPLHITLLDVCISSTARSASAERLPTQ